MPSTQRGRNGGRSNQRSKSPDSAILSSRPSCQEVQFTHLFACSGSVSFLCSIALRRAYLDRNPFAAVFTLHHVLDNGIAGEHLIHARYAVEREAYTEELEDLVEEEPVLFVRLVPL